MDVTRIGEANPDATQSEVANSLSAIVPSGMTSIGAGILEAA